MNDFPAIPLLVHRPYDGIHELYLSQEPLLLAAIMRGDRGEADTSSITCSSISTARERSAAIC